jgi:hypothetical protein
MRYEVVTPSANVTLTAGPHRVAVDHNGGTQVEVSEVVAKVRALSHEVGIWAQEYTSAAIGRARAVSRLFMTGGAYVLELDDGTKGLAHTAGWPVGYLAPRRTQFVGPGPTAFERGWFRDHCITKRRERLLGYPPCVPAPRRFTISRLYCGK